MARVNQSLLTRLESKLKVGRKQVYALIQRKGLQTHLPAVVVLFSPDDEAKLRAEFLKATDGPDERTLTGQPRPNVLFEAGMAFGSKPDNTVSVQLGEMRPFKRSQQNLKARDVSSICLDRIGYGRARSRARPKPNRSVRCYSRPAATIVELQSFSASSARRCTGSSMSWAFSRMMKKASQARAPMPLGSVIC